MSSYIFLSNQGKKVKTLVLLSSQNHKSFQDIFKELWSIWGFFLSLFRMKSVKDTYSIFIRKVCRNIYKHFTFGMRQNSLRVVWIDTLRLHISSVQKKTTRTPKESYSDHDYFYLKLFYYLCTHLPMYIIWTEFSQQKKMSARNLLQLWYCKQVILSFYSSTDFKLDVIEVLQSSCMLFILQFL